MSYKSSKAHKFTSAKVKTTSTADRDNYMLLMPEKFKRMITIISVFLVLFSFAGCKEKPDKPMPPEKPALQTKPFPPEKPAAPSEALTPGGAKPGTLKTLPFATLTGLKINEDHTRNLTTFHINLSETFIYNIVQKADPERIIVVLHKTTKGKAPGKIEVNNGTVSYVEITELNTGKDAAVRITIRLTGKTTYDVFPSDNALDITIPGTT
ncbi:MAG: AMIN domain-containing protein [Planctomycetes bacterium]|nr:AMIN domain-containing protein [Planctomycetota bacterium]